MNLPRKPQFGFTLVELLVGMVLGLFLIGAVILVFTASRDASDEAESLARIQENLRFAADLMIRDIRNAGFRDDPSLSFNESNEQIANGFAQILPANETGDFPTLVIRYAGRGTCTEMFDFGSRVLVENRYTVNDNAELTCNEQALVGGVSNISFEFICPNDGAGNPIVNCNCNIGTSTAVELSCIGVRVELELLRGRNAPSQTVELTAAFRNVIFERLALD